MPRRWPPRRRTVIILAVVIVVLAAVAWVVPGFVEGYRGGYQEGLLIGIPDSCVSSATDAAQARRLDVGTPEFTRKIERYCSCVADAVKSGSATTAELSVFSTQSAGGGSDGREGAAGHRELPALSSTLSN